jgi:hypothetical protein
MVETVYTSVGLWGLCYNQYEIQTINIKEKLPQGEIMYSLDL